MLAQRCWKSQLGITIARKLLASIPFAALVGYAGELTSAFLTHRTECNCTALLCALYLRALEQLEQDVCDCCCVVEEHEALADGGEVRRGCLLVQADESGENLRAGGIQGQKDARMIQMGEGKVGQKGGLVIQHHDGTVMEFTGGSS